MDIKYYDLIPSQQTMYLMYKYTLHKQVSQVPTSFTIDADIDFALLARAFNKEIERNDALRLRFVKEGKSVKQYFLPSFKRDKIKVLSFKSEAEQNAYFGKDAQKPVYFDKGEPYRIYFFNSFDGKKGIYFCVSHIVMDAMGMMIFFNDLLGVYKALKNNTEMPAPLSSYEDYINAEFDRLANEKRQKKAEEFYREYFKEGGEPFYAGVHGPAFLEKARKKKKNPNLRVPAAYNPLYDKAEIITHDISAEDSKKIMEFCLAHDTAPESLLTLGLRIYCAAINYRIDDVFMMLMCSKRVTYKDMNMSGCTAQPLQFRTILSEDMTFEQALQKYLAVRTKLFRHMTFPYITARDMSREIYNYNMIQGPACMMFSWIPVPINEFKEMNISFCTYNLGAYFTPLYTICFPNPETMGLTMSYMYRTKLSTPADIDALHKNAVKAIVAGISNPDITIGELLDGVTK